MFVDSGADDNFTDCNLVTQANISTQKLSESKEVLAIDGRLIERATHKTTPISLTLSGNHHETVELFIISSPLIPVVLGVPWLKLHNPHIDWSTATIVN